MAVTPLSYAKSWENAEDFPTYQPDEAQVRADLQYFPAVLRTYINSVLIGAIEDLQTDKYDADNPSGFQTSTQVTAAINAAIGSAIGGSY